jgi:hypothetical protein
MKKHSINELRDLIRSYVVKALQEAEEDEAPKDDASADDAGGEDAASGEEGGDNPFAAGGDDAGGGEEAGGEEAGAEGGEEGGEEEEGGAKAAPQKDVPTIEFDFSAVKRYNPNTQFLGSEGQVLKVTKRGLIVNVLPDNVQVVVNFDDIKNNQ